MLDKADIMLLRALYFDGYTMREMESEFPRVHDVKRRIYRLSRFGLCSSDGGHHDFIGPVWGILPDGEEVVECPDHAVPQDIQDDYEFALR